MAMHSQLLGGAADIGINKMHTYKYYTISLHLNTPRMTSPSCPLKTFIYNYTGSDRVSLSAKHLESEEYKNWCREQCLPMWSK